MKIGCHLSSSGGYLAMANQALEINANTFQFFTRNPRGGAAKEIDKNDVNKYLQAATENNIEISKDIVASSQDHYKDPQGRKIDEFEEGATAAFINEILSMADAILIS